MGVYATASKLNAVRSRSKERRSARDFYEIEALKAGWSGRSMEQGGASAMWMPVFRLPRPPQRQSCYGEARMTARALHLAPG